MSLRARLLLALIALAAAGLLVADVATAASLRSYLLKRVDQQLISSQAQVESQLGRVFGGGPFGGGGDRRAARVFLPPGTYVELRDANGDVTGSSPSAQVPAISSKLYAVVVQSGETKLTTARSANGATKFRVLIDPQPSGGAVILAVPMHDVDQTLRRLLLLEGGISIAVLIALGLVAWWVVQIGVRPLERMGETAGAIAAGDLSRRVEDTDPGTEVGRLGIALNEMLAQIESAFAQRAASEDRLRRFLADASHELRTPLTSIRGYAELFRRGADRRPDDLAKVMRRIEDEAGRMGVLVEDLLLLARLDEGRPFERSAVDMARVTADAVDDARARDPEREIRLEAWPSIVVQGDRSRLLQVVSNLLGNAVDHTPEGTPVEVRVFVDGGEACVDVADHGPGLTRDEATHVFDRFYRADPSRTRASGGAGLGLAIVAAIVHAHDGSVAVASTPGQGATFRVRLPLAVESAPGTAPATAATPPAAEDAPDDGEYLVS
jgi:two-component system OmpR family sensor kinase